jgi:hypothetical protein
MDLKKIQEFQRKEEEKIYKSSRTYCDWMHKIKTEGPKQQKPVQYDGVVYRSKKECIEKLKIDQKKLNNALKSGELDGRPISLYYPKKKSI